MRLITIALILSVIAVAETGDSGNIDLVVVIDVSGSMQSNDLVQPVQDYFDQTLDLLLEVGDTVTLITFGTGAYSNMQTVEIEDEASTDQLKEYVSNLEFTDQKTYHALAIQSAFEKCTVLEGQYPAHQKVILFLTDGDNDPPEGLPDEIKLDEVKVDSSSYNTDWFVVHIQMNENENTEIGQTLSSIFGDNYLFSPNLVDAFSRLEDLLQSFVFLRFEPAETLDITLREENIACQRFVDVILPADEGIPADLIEFDLDFPTLPEEVQLRDSIVTISGNRIRYFLNAELVGDLPQCEHCGFIIPKISDAGNYVLGGGVQDIDVEIRVEPIGPTTIAWNPSTESIELDIGEAGTVYRGQIALEDLPFDMDVSLLSIQLDPGRIPEGIQVDHSLEFPLEGQANILLTAKAVREVPNGEYIGELLVRLRDNDDYSAETLSIPIKITTRIIPPTWPRNLAILLGLLTLIVVIVYLLKTYNKKKLFGMMYCWREDDPSNRIRKDLSKCGLRCDIGSNDFKLPGLEKALASMSVEKVGKHRLVKLIPSGEAKLLMDGEDRSSIHLHNHDTFSLDGWHFEYRGKTVRRNRERS